MIRNIFVTAMIALLGAPALAQGASDPEKLFSLIRPQFELCGLRIHAPKAKHATLISGGFIVSTSMEAGAQRMVRAVAVHPRKTARATARAFATRLQTLGASIAQEWAKPNNCRKISTFGTSDSLTAYGASLEPYLNAQGAIDPTALGATLKQIEDSVQKATSS